MTTTKLNPVQLHLLKLFVHDLSQDELGDIKKLLTDYFIQKADEEMATLQQHCPTTQADLDTLLTTHLRTSYK